jgi:hypothetical protein
MYVNLMQDAMFQPQKWLFHELKVAQTMSVTFAQLSIGIILFQIQDFYVPSMAFIQVW